MRGTLRKDPIVCPRCGRPHRCPGGETCARCRRELIDLRAKERQNDGEWKEKFEWIKRGQG